MTRYLGKRTTVKSLNEGWKLLLPNDCSVVLSCGPRVQLPSTKQNTTAGLQSVLERTAETWVT